MTPSILTLDEIKAAFPTWLRYVRLEAGEDDATVDARLARAAAEAETELAEYVPAEAAQLEPEAAPKAAQFRRHLLNITRKNCFDLTHGNTAFESKPQIVRDYEATLDLLERYRSGELDVPLPGDEAGGKAAFRVNAKPRRFGTWFND